MADLAPCPRCGSEARVMKRRRAEIFIVACRKCSERTAEHRSRGGAESAWNTPDVLDYGARVFEKIFGDRNG